MNRYRLPTLGWALLVLPLAYGGYLVWQEQAYRQALRVMPVFTPVSTSLAHSPLPFKPEAIATVLGLGTQGAWVKSAEPLQLRASFVSSLGKSQALLADAQGARFYAVGERLPGGSVLRRVEAGYVALWRNGREERLTLKSASQHLIPASAATRSSAPAAPLHLRPFAKSPRETQ